MAVGGDGSPAAQRYQNRFRSHGLNARGRFQEMRPRDQRAAQQSLRFLLAGLHHGGARFHPVGQGFAIGIEQRFHVMLVGQTDQLAIKIRRNPGRNAPAQHQPIGSCQARGHGPFNLLQLSIGNGRTGLVQLDGKPVLVGDGEVLANLFRDAHHFHGKARGRQQLLEALARFAAGGNDGQRFRPEGMQHAG